MAKKEVDMDAELAKAEEVIVEDPPKTCDVPEGWSPIAALDVSECWYERVLAWEQMFGRKMLPLKYSYTESGTIVLTEDLEKNKEKEDGDSVK